MDEIVEVECPCCIGTGKVMAADGVVRNCPICEGFTTVPEEVAQRFLEVAARKLAAGTD